MKPTNVYQVLFQKSKYRFVILKRDAETRAEAAQYIKEYKGYHKKENMVICEKRIVINPYKSKRVKKV